MNKFFVYVLLISALACGIFPQRANAFWKLPIKLQIGDGNYSVENNEYYQTRQEALNAVEKIISSYESRRYQRFMSLVSEDFVYDKDNLSYAIRQDFLKYSYININFVINNAIKSSDGKIAVSINYSRSMEDRTADKFISDSGTASFVLVKDNNTYKLYSMQRPYLFGITGF